MDLTSRSMYDTFKDDIWKELGPLDSDWFDVLTSQRLPDEGNGCRPDDLRANQERNFKTPFDTTASDSQLFSTPRVFRHSGVVSPETEDDQSFTNEKEKETLPWTATHSPYLFQMSREGVPAAKYEGMQPQGEDSFDLLHTPLKFPVNNAKQISESLGAQIHSDISWTSSLNTPPAVPSTLILSKTDESPCPLSVSADKNVVIVRKLFPSLSNVPKTEASLPQNIEVPALHQGLVSLVADDNSESQDSPEISLNQSEGVWRRKLPDAIEDGEIRSTVASVLEGAENVLSIFFTNNNSALRKVKTERNKRKQIIATKEKDCSATDTSTINTASTERKMDDQEPGECSLSPVGKTVATGISQWSPLSLSEIPPCTVDPLCHDNNRATQAEKKCLTLHSDSSHLVMLPITITNSGLTKKRRKFIYTVENLKPEVQGKKMLSEKMDLSPSPDFGYKTRHKQLGKVQEEADCCIIGRNEIQNQENVDQESVPSSVQAKVQELDMSQLCRDFDEEFSQMSDLSKLSKVAEVLPQNHFSPSACLSAMKQTKQKAREANLHQNWDGISNRRHPSSSNPNFSINGPAVSDSGFQSTVADLTHATTTSFVLHNSENNTRSQSGFEADSQKTASILCRNKETGNTHLNDKLQETDANLYSAIKESQILDSGTESGLHKESMSTQLPWSAERTVDNINWILLNGQDNVGLPEKKIVSLPSICAAGFKTASNKGIDISSDHLERVKNFFQQNEAERTFSEQPTKSAHDAIDALTLRNGSMKGITSKSKTLLATEICSNNSCQLTASQKADVTELCTLLEEADSQFGFTQFKAAKLKPLCEDNATSLQRVEKELDTDFLMGIDFDDSFTSDAEKQTTTTVRPDKPDNSEINKQGNKPSLTIDVGFKTAGGIVLRVSEQCVSKGRALFADLEEDLKEQKSPVRQSSETDAKTEHGEITGLTNEGVTKGFEISKMDITTRQSRFQKAGGKEISVSAKAFQNSFNDNQSLTVKAFSSSNTTVKDTGSCATSELNIGCGFSTASGKKVSKSADAMKKAECLLKEINALGETKKLKEAFTTDYFNQRQLAPCNNCGFQTASGKGVVISPAALKTAKSLLNECEAVEPTYSKMPVPGPPDKNFGFVAASGKPMALSAEAIQKANALFSDIDLSAKIPAVSDTTDSDKTQEKAAFSDSNISGGFSTPSGRNGSVSNDALTKANSLLSESIAFEDTNTKFKHCEDTLPPQTAGFQTASGKGVAVSYAALKKAKTFLSECSNKSGENGVKQMYSKIPFPGPHPVNSGFHVASGKPVALSGVTLQNVKAHFGDISFSPEIPAVYDPKNREKTQDPAGKTHCGFMTAGGTVVHVSQKSLLKAKHLLKEFDDCPISAKAVYQDTDVGPRFGCAEFVNIDVGPVMKHKNILYLDMKKEAVNKNTSDSTNLASLYENPSLLAKPLTSQLCMASKNISSCTFSEFSSAAGDCTASRKNVFVSGGELTKANCLFDDTLPIRNNSFQTASGKGVTISTAALKKAKILLSECEGVNDKIGVKPTHSQMPFSGPLPKNIKFHGSSGLPGALSFEGTQKVKALFSDIPAISETRKTDRYDGAQNYTQVTHCGFTTAGGAKVNVSQKSLMKAKNLLKEFDGGDRHDSDLHSKSPHDTHKSDRANLKDVRRTSAFNITSVSVVSNEESVRKVCQSFPSLQETGRDNQTQQIVDSSVHSCISINKEPTIALKCKVDKTTTSELASVLDHGVTRAIFNKGPKLKRMEQSSFFTFQSLHLSGCTEMQQTFLAQEALDCTKALLEDDGLADQNLSVTLENVPLLENSKSNKTSVEEQKGRGKRSVEGTDMTGQPPLKRRLLEEFDRTVDGPRHSTLHPEKNCPNGVMNDRRVFKYSEFLHPNIIKPYRNGKNYVETRLQKTAPTQYSTPGAPRSACSKMPVFVPPFHKNTKTQTLKNTVLTNNKRTPAFIPPFKKQRTIVQDSSPKAQEDLHHRLFVTVSKSNTSKFTDDVPTVALAYSTHNNQMTNQSLPVGCGTEDSDTEALGVEDLISRDEGMFQVLESVELARDMQDMRIRKKRRQTIRPLPGSLFLAKTSGVTRMSLKAAVNGKPPARYTQEQLYGYGVQQHVSEITSETAENFRFNLLQFFKQESFIDNGCVQLADGGWLVTRNDGTAGKEEFYRALCDTPGVDPKLISKEWVYNHYRWIVWKQASVERSFPETVGSLCLTPEQVLLQLKYRYDVEVDHSRRPALRKIMERDDTASKTLVLCVCGIISRGQSPNRKSCSDAKTPQGTGAKSSQFENPSAIIWLTDGWYAIKAELDEPLTAMLHKGRLAIGGKLIIYGAQLVGSQDACSPLEAPEALMLKICANSSRPARWDIKLGFYKDPRPFLLPVSCLYGSGGPVGCVDIIVLRSYPMQWMERKADGGIVFRSVRAEEKEARRHNSHKHKAMEMLFAKIQAEFEREEKGNKSQHTRQTMSRQEIASLQDGEELYEAVGDDPSYIEAHLSEQQFETLQTYRHSLMEKKRAELQDRYRRALEAEDNEGSCLKRDVTPVWRLCVADSMDHHGSVYQLNLWRPSSDLQSLLKEGCRYKVFNLNTLDGRKRSGIETIQLTGMKKTQFQDLQTSQEWLSARFQPRVSTSFLSLYNTEFQPLCGEVDLTGCVISIIDEKGSSPAFYLVDGKLNFVKVRCFNSLSQSGLEDVVKAHVFLALSNLQLRGQSTSPTPVVYAGDLTVFSANPKEVHLRESLSQLRNLIQAYENFYLAAEEKLSYLIKSDGLRSVSSPALEPQSPASVTDRSQDAKTNVIFQQPARNLGSFTPVNRNLPTTTSSTEKDPRSLKRRRALDYLSRIPSPPGLSHLSSAASPCVKKTFNPPRSAGTLSTLKTVQTAACKPLSSPVEDEWVNDEELAMIDTQALRVGDVDT